MSLAEGFFQIGVSFLIMAAHLAVAGLVIWGIGLVWVKCTPNWRV